MYRNAMVEARAVGLAAGCCVERRGAGSDERVLQAMTARGATGRARVLASARTR